MGSSHFGEVSLGNNGKSGSSRKGKKSGNINEKPKQPQRGLGVAQLEKIRLQNQMASYLPSSLHHPPPFHGNINKHPEEISTATSASVFPLQYPNNTMMGFGEVDQRLTDIGYVEVQSSYTARPFLNHNNAFPPHHGEQRTITLPLLEQNMKDSTKERRHDRCRSLSSTSQNSDSSDTQELDLDLKLSL